MADATLIESPGLFQTFLHVHCSHSPSSLVSKCQPTIFPPVCSSIHPPPLAHIHLELRKCLLHARHPWDITSWRRKWRRQSSVDHRPYPPGLTCTVLERYSCSIGEAAGAMERLLCTAKCFMNEATSTGLGCQNLPVSAWPPPLGPLLGNGRKSTYAIKDVRPLLGWTLLSW